MECKGCTDGIKMCYHRPCFGTPEEFDKILDAGFANKLHLDYWVGKIINKDTLERELDIYMLSGAIYQMDVDLLIKESSCLSDEESKTDEIKDVTKHPYRKNHSGGYTAPFIPIGKCALLTEDNLCSLHELGLKPEQGRDSCCNKENCLAKNNEYYAKLWNTDYGKSVVEKWKQLVNN